MRIHSIFTLVLMMTCFTAIPSFGAEESKDYLYETFDGEKSTGKTFVLPSTNLDRDIEVLFEELFTKDLPNADAQMKSDILFLVGKLAKGLKVPELPLSVRRVEYPNGQVRWSLGSEHATVWNFLEIQNEKFLGISLLRVDGSCDGEPFGTCCGGNGVGDPPLWTTEEERIAIRDAVFRLRRDMTTFQGVDGFLVSDLPTFAQMPHLEEIFVRNYAFTPESVRYFHQFPELRKITASDSTLDDAATLALLDVAEFSGWDLRRVSPPSESAPAPAPGRLCPIRVLALTGDLDSSVFARLAYFPELETLRLSRVRMSASDLKYLQDVPKLRELYLNANGTDMPGAAFEFADLPQLQNLTFGYYSMEIQKQKKENPLAEAGEGFRVTVHRLPALTELKTEPYFAAHNSTHLGTLPQLRNLEALGHQEVTFEEGAVLPELRRLLGVPFNRQTIAALRASEKLKNLNWNPIFVEDLRDLEWFRDRFGAQEHDLNVTFTASALSQLPPVPATFSEYPPSGGAPARMLDLTWFGQRINASEISLYAPELPDAGNVYVRFIPEPRAPYDRWRYSPGSRLVLENVRLAPDNLVLLHCAKFVELRGRSVTAAALEELTRRYYFVRLKLTDVTPESTDFFREFLSHPEWTSAKYPYEKICTGRGGVDTVEISFSEEAVERFRGQTLTFGPMPEVAVLRLSAPSPGLKVAFPEGVGKPKMELITSQIEVVPNREPEQEPI